MAQAFRPGSNTIARMAVAALFLGPFAVLYALTAFNLAGYVTRAQEPIGQPVPFSHQHHAGQLGIDCRYCHASVENSSFANLPPTHNFDEQPVVDEKPYQYSPEEAEKEVRRGEW